MKAEEDAETPSTRSCQDRIKRDGELVELIGPNIVSCISSDRWATIAFYPTYGDGVFDIVVKTGNAIKIGEFYEYIRKATERLSEPQDETISETDVYIKLLDFIKRESLGYLLNLCMMFHPVPLSHMNEKDGDIHHIYGSFIRQPSNDEDGELRERAREFIDKEQLRLSTASL